MAQDVSQPRHFPWWKILLVAGLPTLVLAFGIGSVVGGTRQSNPANSGPSLPAMVRAVETPKPTPTPTPTPSPIAWPIVQVVWTLVTDLSILLPAEEGFYNGTMQNRPWGSSSTPEWAAYVGTIVQEFGNAQGTAAIVAATRAPNNRQVVLVGATIAYPARIENHQILEDARTEDRLFLSVDGENSWREIQLPLGRFEKAIVVPEQARVIAQEDTILLFVKAEGGGDGRWHQAILPR